MFFMTNLLEFFRPVSRMWRRYRLLVYLACYPIGDISRQIPSSIIGKSWHVGFEAIFPATAQVLMIVAGVRFRSWTARLAPF
jgi:hypothetical protein